MKDIGKNQFNELQSLILRAIKNGFQVEGELKHIRPSMDNELIVTFTYRRRDFTNSAYFFLFNHDFAKALFGDGVGGSYYKLNDPKRTERKLWEHILQQAVIAPNPIDYMYDEVFGK